MKLSIIVPVYNVKPYLRQCVDSLLAQTIDDYEIILVDDGATDGSGELVSAFAAEHPERIKAIHIDNGGQGRAKNFALEAATGEYLGFVDSDDWISPEMYNKLLRKADETGADIVICDFMSVYADGREEYLPSTVTLKERGRAGGCCNKLFSRRAAEGLRFPEALWYEDLYYASIALLRAERVEYVPEALYYYRMLPVSTMHNSNAEKNLDIIAVADFAKEYMLPRGLEAEAEAFVIDHVLLDAINRVSAQNADSGEEVIAKLRAYVHENIPNLFKCESYRREHFKRKIVMLLNYRGMHRAAKLIFSLKRSL